MPDRASVTDYKFSLVWAVVSLRADTAPYNKITSNMKQAKLLFLLITLVAMAGLAQEIKMNETTINDYISMLNQKGYQAYSFKESWGRFY